MLSKNFFRYRFDCGCKGKNFFYTDKFFEKKIWRKILPKSPGEKIYRLAPLTSSLFTGKYPATIELCQLYNHSRSNAGTKVLLYNIYTKLFRNFFSLLGIKLIRLIFEKVFFGMYCRFSLFFCLYIQNELNGWALHHFTREAEERVWFYVLAVT